MWLGFLNKANETFTHQWASPLCVLQKVEDSYSWEDPECSRVPMTFEIDHADEFCVIDKVELTALWKDPVCDKDLIEYDAVFESPVCLIDKQEFQGIWTDAVCLSDQVIIEGIWSNVVCEKDSEDFEVSFEEPTCIIEQTELVGIWSDAVCDKDIIPDEEEDPEVIRPGDPSPTRATLIGTFTFINESDHDVILSFPVQTTGLVYFSNLSVPSGATVSALINYSNAYPGENWAILSNSASVRFENGGSFAVSNATINPLSANHVAITPVSYFDTECFISGNLRITNAPII